MERPDCINQKTAFETIEWLTGNAEKPEMADQFINTICYLYTERIRRDSQSRRHRKYRTASPMSLKELVNETRTLEKERMMKAEAERLNQQADKVSESIQRFLKRNGHEQAEPQAQEKTEAERKEKTNIQMTPEDLARATRQAAREADRDISWSHMNLAVYMMYGIWMAEKGERLTQEQPTASRYGPLFTTLFKIPKKKTDREEEERGKDREAMAKIKDGDPLIYALVSRTAYTVSAQPVSSLTQEHTSKGTPWHKTTSKAEGENVKIDDQTICEWFKGKIRKVTLNAK